MPPADAPAALAETHSAIVVFVGDHAYKFKKPVDLGFLDFRTLADREAACRREVDLNRRMAPDVYLGTGTVTDPDGEVCEHLVVMRRLPDDRRLTACLARGEDVGDALRHVARDLAVLHAAPPSGVALVEVARQDAVRRHWTDGFEQLATLPNDVVDRDLEGRIEELALRYVDGRGVLFDERIRRGHVTDGHGDLQAEDVFLLPDGPRAIDCLDFSAELRWGDVLLDVGFLAMDLERLGHPDVADRFLADYREFSAERWPSSLAHHYIGYRAHVRAKVAALRAVQSGAANDAAAVTPLLDLCRRHLEAGRVRIVLVGGSPGTGKSTLAAALGDRADAVVVRTDEVRRETAGPSRDRPDGAATYSADAVDDTYRRAVERAAHLAALGEHVILDATWGDAAHRATAREIAASAGADVVEIRCVAPDDVADGRIRDRLADGRDASDATPEVARRLRDRFAPWPEAIVVDTDGPEANAVEAAARATGWA